MKKIVVTGGPCGGKSTVLSALREEFVGRVVLVPEVATMLLGSGFPVPGRDLPWSLEWQSAFQAAVLPLQRSIEDALELKAAADGTSVLVCDRGELDGAAYTPGGVPEFCTRFGVNGELALARYSAIIHLESLATADPLKYGKAGNDNRFEPLEKAVELENATRAAWAAHPRHLVIEGRRGIEGKISEVIGIIRFILAEKEVRAN